MGKQEIRVNSQCQLIEPSYKLWYNGSLSLMFADQDRLMTESWDAPPH